MAEAAGAGAQLVVFPEVFVPAYPSSSWARFLASWDDDRAKAAFAVLAREAVEVPGPGSRRLGEIASAHGVWLVVGVVAAAQRGYFGSDEDVSCKELSDTALTVLAGPLNYLGVNPKVECDLPEPELPEPSE